MMHKLDAMDKFRSTPPCGGDLWGYKHLWLIGKLSPNCERANIHGAWSGLTPSYLNFYKQFQIAVRSANHTVKCGTLTVRGAKV